MLTWTKSNAGYLAISDFGSYEARRTIRGKFQLWVNNAFEYAGKGTLAGCKDRAYALENDRIERGARAVAEANVVTPVVVEGDASPLAKAVVAPLVDRLIAEGVIPVPANGFQVNRGGQHGPSPLDDGKHIYCTDEEPDCCESAPGDESCIGCGKPVRPLQTFGQHPLGPVVPTPAKPSVLSGLANRPKDISPHLIVEARAGTGKTTTLIEGLKRIKGCPTEGFVPSPQQAEVFEAMEQSKGLANSIMFVAFNKSIADELKQRVPAGCEASTMHGLGFKAVNQAFRGLRVEQHRVSNIIGELMGRDVRDLRREKPALVQATEKLVGLCKMNLVAHWDNDSMRSLGMAFVDKLTELATHYDVDLDKDRAEVFALVPRVLDRCKDVERDKCLNFDDMIFLPIALGLAVPKYDLLLIDERQDLNKCQMQLALKAGRRIIAVGDKAQSIYGFAGADANACENFARMLESHGDRGVVQLPLTVTRRCGKAIVKEAQKFVPDFSAFESNPEGMVTYSRMESKDEMVPAHMIYRSLVQDGDMVLCRVNAPLVRECFRFLKAGRKANIQGRDIGQGLISTVTKMKAVSIPDLVTRLGAWLDQETAKELAKKNPSETRIEALQDRLDCLMCFTDGQTTVDGVVRRIESVFTDDKTVKGIRLSSVHKAKGLEAHQVFILQGKGCNGGGGKRKDDKPEPAWVAEQNRNLRYVAITRAIQSLVYVS